ncbi:MAG: hypothetical protein R3C05_31130 [Pirellulaceae bacterium]
MSEIEPRRSVTPKFSVLNLLMLTALAALATAIFLAYRKNQSLIQYRDELLDLSSRLQVENENKLASSELPNVASDFHSWRVHIPDGRGYELKLGVGAISENEIPPIVDAIPISAGQHRVTLHTADSASEEFRYVVYVDGNPVIEETMGSEWIPGGWSSASGMNWPRYLDVAPTPLQLHAQSYKPKHRFDDGSYFNGRSDEYVTRKGYRLWIDESDRQYAAASPFMGFAYDPSYQGIGLRDGLRFKMSSRSPYQWTFTRPSLETNDPLLQMNAEFFGKDGKILSSQTPSFQSWQIRNDARGEKELKWEKDSDQSAYTAFLKAKIESNETPQPVVELRWERGRPDEVGMRIADTPANDAIERSRIRITGGIEHLWRELRIGDRDVTADDAKERGNRTTPADEVTFDIADDPGAEIRIQWQTNETLPLQILGRQRTPYSGMSLYEGLPVTFGVEIPAVLKPTMAVRLVEHVPQDSAQTFPGGTVYDEIQIDFASIDHDWIWFQAKAKE